MRTIAALALIFLCVPALTASCAGRTVSPAADPKTDATAAATEWIELVDEGSYAESWSRSSSQFQQATTAADWATVGSEARNGFGALTSRTLKTATSTKEVPGGRPGDYYVLDFASVFAARGAVTERITVVLESGAWRVTGYFIM